MYQDKPDLQIFRNITKILYQKKEYSQYQSFEILDPFLEGGIKLVHALDQNDYELLVP
jgi:hypothetical protein